LLRADVVRTRRRKGGRGDRRDGEAQQ